MVHVITVINWFILIYFIFLSLGYIILLFASIPEIFIRFKEHKIGDIESLMRSKLMPAVTVIVPAYNESGSIIDAVESIRKSDYPNLYITIISPGSTDDTMNKLIKKYQFSEITPYTENNIKTFGKINGYYISSLFKNITLIDKEHTDRSDTLNVGINSCHTPLFMTCDADSLIEPDAISNILFYLLARPYMLAAGGAVLVLNGNTFKDGTMIATNISLNPIYAFQTCEYLRSFYFGRTGWNRFGGSLSYAGTFTIFNKEAAIEVGGYQLKNLAQDFEIITHIHADYRQKKSIYRVGYTPSAAVWTDVPGSLKEYWKQRYNWQYSIWQSLMPYIRMLYNPKFGITGFFTYPFFLFGETFSAIVEFTAYLMVFISWYIGTLDVRWTLLFIVVCWGFSIALTMTTFLLDIVTFNRYRKLRNIILIMFFSIVEIFGFRQFNVVCRFTATFSYFVKALISWGKKTIAKAI